MKKIGLSIIVIAALSTATGCLSPNGGLQPMPWWPMGGDGWNKPANQPSTSPPTTQQYMRKGAVNPSAQRTTPQRPTGDAINVTVGDE
ncbi:hypothetical protein [Anatilimnocola floriformis]|uniref:hypothetical protein n=1 Tax=Anatilimnocola floriformis TaxID=2948575 RepID=UPI0020C36FFE|nr:hypothetical protein [Anatilimnocola floriformis]